MMQASIIAPVMNPLTLAAWVAALFLGASLFSHTVALRLLLLAAGILLAALAVARGNRDVRALPAIWVPFTLWAVWAAFSIAWSVEPEHSIKEFRNEVFYAGAGLWICYVGGQARNAPSIFLAVLGLAALAVCAVALTEFSRGPIPYSTGWHGGPGNHSSALLTLMPCALMAGWYAARARRPLWASVSAWALVALFLASAYTTLNRTVWVGFAAELIVLAALLLRRGVFSARVSRLVLIACTAAALAGAGAMVQKIQAEREAIGVARALEDDSRLALWPEIFERIDERPLTGYGFGRGLLRGSLRQELGSVDPYLWHAHNLLLEALLQTGAPGLLLLLLLLGATVREAWHLARDADEGTAACGIALVGVVAGMLVRNMTDTLLVRQNALLYWGIVGVLLGLGTRSWRASS